MNKIIGVPMPADKALKIIRSINKSNPTADIKTYQKYVGNEVEFITITSITQIIPTYSCGDRVLILSTGEIKKILATNDVFGKGNVMIQKGTLRTTEWIHRSEICKLPNDL